MAAKKTKGKGKLTKKKRKQTAKKAMQSLEEEEEEMVEITLDDVNYNLMKQLEVWVDQCDDACNKAEDDRRKIIVEFCTTFVPTDVTNDELLEYANSLVADNEFFQSVRRELGQCLRGEGLERVRRNISATKVEFTLLPPQDIDTSLDLVREICFITGDGGETWTAEV